MSTDTNKKILGSIDKRFIGEKVTSFSAAYFSNFPISSIVENITTIVGIDRVIDYDTSYHIEVFFNIDTDYNHKLLVVNSLFNEIYNTMPQYI